MRVVRVLLGVLIVGGMPMTARAQVAGAITGVVRDSQGGVMPGVTVEASSPVLIEKVRTAVTDSTGRYTVPELRSGTYTVTFTLTGFATVKREGVELMGTATVAVDAEMRVGSVSETITVSGEVPLVDVQTTRRQTVLDQQVVTAIPTSRNSFSVGVLIPGVNLAFSGTLGSPNNAQDVGGSLGPSTESLSAHGSRMQDQRQAVNGVALSTMIGGGWGGGAVPNATGTSEFAIDTAAVDASLATGGPRVNFIPKDGGNRLSVTLYGSYATEGFQSASSVTRENFPAIRANTIQKNGDFNPGVGGPIVKDKLWIYLSGRYQVANNFVPGMFYNLNANKPDPRTHIVSFKPDLSRPALSPRDFSVYMGRLTWQASQKNKFGITYDLESNCFCPNNVSATRSPEAATDRRFPLQRFVQVDWNSPISSKVLLEASAIHRVERWGDMQLQTGNGGNIAALDPTIIGISDVGLAPAPLGFNYGAAAQGLAPGSPAYNNSWNYNWHYRAALSYITGSHTLKVGFNNATGHFENLNYDINPMFYSFSNGVPQAINIKDSPNTVQVDVDRDFGLFAQDRWRVKRWSLYGGIRYDSFKNSFPAFDLLPTQFVPNRPITHFARQDNISWNDITPKLGASYDLFGGGKTALKVSLNKYLLGYGTAGFFENGLSSAPHPINTLTTSTTIGWNDANGDFVPQCDVLNPAPNGECSGWSSPFGSLVPTTSYDPKLLSGWGRRNYNWEFSVGVQHEILPRVSVEASYFRRIFGNFQMTSNRALSAASFDRFTFTVPNDPRLPNAGATLTAVDARFPQAFAQDYFVTLADDQNVNMTDHWDGVDLTTHARLRNLTLQGGLSVGREALNQCDLMNKFPENTLRFLPGPSAGDHAGGSPSFLPFFAAEPLDYCNRNEGFAPQVKVLGSYLLSKIDVQVAATYQSIPGGLEEAQYLEFTTGSLRRAYGTSPIVPFREFQIVEPGSLRLDRINQFDFRVSKIFKMGRTKTNVNFDLYNVFNNNAVTQENFTYVFVPGVPAANPWRQPQYVVPSRFFKLSAQFDF